MNADDKRNSEVAALKAETEDQSELLLEASPSTSAKRRRSTAAATAAMEGEGVVASTSASASPSNKRTRRNEKKTTTTTLEVENENEIENEDVDVVAKQIKKQQLKKRRGLPDELWDKILESVDDNSVLAFACVCKQLRRVQRRSGRKLKTDMLCYASSSLERRYFVMQLFKYAESSSLNEQEE